MIHVVMGVMIHQARVIFHNSRINSILINLQTTWCRYYKTLLRYWQRRKTNKTFLANFLSWSNVYAWDRSFSTRAVSDLTHKYKNKLESFASFYVFCLFVSDKSKRFYNIDYCMTDYESSEGLHYTCFCDPPSKVRLFFFFFQPISSPPNCASYFCFSNYVR